VNTVEIVNRVMNRGGVVLEDEMEYLCAVDALVHAARRLAESSGFDTLFVVNGCVKAVNSMAKRLPERMKQ
jgi:hypothetical protein